MNGFLLSEELVLRKKFADRARKLVSVDRTPREEVINISSKPVVARALPRGDYESGLTHMEHVEEHGDLFRLDLDIGESTLGGLRDEKEGSGGT